MLVIAISCNSNRKTKYQNNIDLGFHCIPSFDMQIFKSHLFEDIVRIFYGTPLLEGSVKFFFVQRNLVCSLLDRVFHSVFDIERLISVSRIVGDDRENAFIYELFLQLNDVKTRITKEYPRFFHQHTIVDNRGPFLFGCLLPLYKLCGDGKLCLHVNYE